MYTIEDVHEILEEIYEEIPKDFFKKLNGGILLLEDRKIHPEAVGDDLFILGTYSQSPGMGRYISIYYGSFMEVYGHLSRNELKIKLRETLFHEFTHHLESLAGLRDLEIKDENFMKRYKGEI